MYRINVGWSHINYFWQPWLFCTIYFYALRNLYILALFREKIALAANFRMKATGDYLIMKIMPLENNVYFIFSYML